MWATGVSEPLTQGACTCAAGVEMLQSSRSAAEARNCLEEQLLTQGGETVLRSCCSSAVQVAMLWYLESLLALLKFARIGKDKSFWQWHNVKSMCL